MHYDKQINDFSLDSDYSWIDDKAEPWWRITDRNELASFVSQKSLNHIENCDLPPPRKKKYLRGPQPCANISHKRIKTASFDWDAKSSFGLSNLNVKAKGNVDSKLMHRTLGPSANEGLSHFASQKSSSYITIHEDVTEKVFEGDPDISQLMEALCHSQTRARQAEEAAKQAFSEKENIVTLIFKQALQLFAYKLWLQLLQQEILHIQIIKNKDQHPIYTLFPVGPPWMSGEDKKTRKRKKYVFAIAKQEWLGKPKSYITTYAIAFALGLSFVGAGLLLGLTMGWMFS